MKLELRTNSLCLRITRCAVYFDCTYQCFVNAKTLVLTVIARIEAVGIIYIKLPSWHALFNCLSN